MTATAADATAAVPRGRLPRQIPYIIGNEGCERFSFYGMRNILTPFLVGSAAAVRCRRPSARDSPRTSSTPSSSASTSSRCSAAGSPTGSSASTTRSSGCQPRLLRRPRLPRAVRRQPHGLLHRPVPDRARLRRHQAAGRVVRRRPVRPDEQAPREGRLRRLLLDHQLRLVLRLAADADLPAQTTGRASPSAFRAC